jgi:cation diffusion facilitator family transporter
LALSALMVAVGVGLLASAIGKLQAPEQLAATHPAALGIALVALVAKEGLFRYLLRVGERLKSSLLVANAWHSRSDAASSLVVALGIGGSVMGFPLLDPIAAVIVGLIIVRMGWQFGRQSLDTLMDRAADADEVKAIRTTLAETPGARGVHDVRTRKMGDLILVDAHLEVDAHISVEAGHAITEDAERRVLQRHRVLDVLIHVDPYHGPPSVDPPPGPP